MEPCVYVPGYPFVICTRCHVGLVVSEVMHHMERHGDISRERIRMIHQMIKAMPDVAQDQAALQCWTSPAPDSGPVPHIKPPVDDGLGCQACPYCVRDIRQMQKHCRQAHGWVNDWKKGGNVTKRAQEERAPRPWSTGVRCQQFAPWGHGRRWFEVDRGIDDARASPAKGEEWDAVAAFFTRLYREDEEAFESEAQAQIRDIDDKWEAQTWLNQCGWPRHLEGIDKERLQATMAPIGEKEPVLQRMWEVFESVLDQAYAAAGRCYPGSAELFEIERKDVHATTTTKPFQRLMEPDAWARYKAWWRVLMSIWHRFEAWGQGANPDESDSQDDGTSESESGHDSDGASETSGQEPAACGRRATRPGYRMTTQQERSWKKFTSSVTQAVDEADAANEPAEGTRERLERHCLDAVVQLFDHPLKSGSHYDSIVISALAVMGLNPQGGWVPVMDYTPIYSAVIKVARYLVLYQSMSEREMQIRRRQQGTGWDRRTAEESADGLFRIVRRKVRRFMTRISGEEDAEPTPMNWIINTRTYGMRIRYTTPGSETIDWRGDQIIHGGRVRLGMGQLSDMLHNLVGEARKTLAVLTMTDQEKHAGPAKRGTSQKKKKEEEEEAPPIDEMLPRIPWSHIEDRHGESGLEHSFLRDEANAWWTEPGREFVMRRMLASATRRKAWLAEPLDERCPVREEAVRGYERAVERFRGQIWMAMHMLGGQPARSTEILGLRMWNTMNAGVRNIFIHEGMVCFVTMYHKGFRKTGNIKIIHRYVPREVGALLVWYMWLVLPFWQAIQGRIKQKRTRSAFLWADEVVSHEGGKEGGPGRRTQTGGGSGATGDPGATRKEEEEREEEAAFMEWFREPKWTSDRVRRVMQQYSARFSGQEINISAWRHIAIGIANRYFNKVFGSDAGGDEFDEDEDGDGSLVDSIYDLQAGHGSHIAGLIYARLFGQGELGTMRSREQFRKVSMQWHRFFGFGAEDRVARGGGAAGVKRVRSIFDAEREDTRRKRFERLHRVDMQGQLKQMMGPAASFRGLQEPVIRAVARGEWPIVQVTPTGGGKSLTFMLPAFCTPDGVTIVVSPLVALESDMEVRCAQMGIDAYVWASRGVQRAASLIFVTPESAVSKGFHAFVARMHEQQKLDRVVVDECHTVLQWTKTFRPHIGRLGSALQDFGVPVICLTATLKPSQERALCQALRFVPARVQMFREATTRRNIQYRVEIIEDDDETSQAGRPKTEKKKKRAPPGTQVNEEGEEEGEADDVVEQQVCAIVRAWTATHAQGKVIVYGGTIQRVQGIGAALGCVAYWRGCGNAEEKARRVAAWRHSTGGPSGWIVATNALGLGVDMPDVRLVVHAGVPRTLVDLAQESGRGGRDGGRSESRVVIRRSWLTQQTEALDARGRQAPEGPGARTVDRANDEGASWSWDEDVVEFVAGGVCRREVLDREMDGQRERFGCVAGEEEVCDVCERQWMERDVRALADMDGEDWDDDDSKEYVRSARAGGEKEEEDEGIEADYERSQRMVRQRESERTRQVMQEACEVDEFETMLAEWDGACAVCRIAGEAETKHALEVCPRKGSPGWVHITQGIKAVHEEMFTQQRFARYSACFECGLPQAVCHQWVAASEDGRMFQRARGRRCQYPGLLVRIFVAQRIGSLDRWADDMAKMMGLDGLDVQDWQQMAKMYVWLGELVEWGGRAGGGIQASRMCQVVVRFHQQ